MLLALRFFSASDIIIAPLVVFGLLIILRSRAKRQTDPFLQKLYYRAFWFKFFCTIAFVCYTEFIFKGGDTALYYQCIADMRKGIDDGVVDMVDVLRTDHLSTNHPLTPYFYYDNYSDDFTYGYMLSTSNFFIPRLGLIPSWLLGHNYLSICLIFSFFALGGTLRLFKFFYHFFPESKVEIAFATIFLPSVGFWSAALLKDPVCFGGLGYIMYAVLSIFVKKKNIFTSILIILACGYLIFNIKVYILLPLILSGLLWLFYDTGKKIRDRTLRNIFIFLAIIVAAGVSVVAINYATSSESAASYRLDNLQHKAEAQRSTILGLNNIGQVGSTSNFEINTSNLFLLIPNSLIATFFRPFLWDIKSPVMVVSFFESLLITFLFLKFVFKKGFFRFFTMAGTNSILLLCFTYAIIFGIFVGSSTSNFGALSRYKIPCMPFFLVYLILIYKKNDMAYPSFFKWIVKAVMPKKKYVPLIKEAGEPVKPIVNPS